MAFRAAANANLVVAGVIAVGGDIPPELNSASLKKISAAIIVRGKSDEYYTTEQFANDEQRLRESYVNVRAIEFAGGHEWSSDVCQAAGQFLRLHHSSKD
jgi:predicted esterase